MNVLNLTGTRYGRLTVKQYLGSSKSGKSVWLCVCDCGEETQVVGSNLTSKRIVSCGCVQREITIQHNKKMSGENAPAWKGGVSKLHTSIRSSLEYREWILKVQKKDDYRCGFCGKRGGGIQIQVHHKKHMSEIVRENNITTIQEAKVCKELWDVDNGMVVCVPCHKEYHAVYGYTRKEYQ